MRLSSLCRQLENPAGPVLVRPTQLVDGGFHVQHRQDRHPLQAPVAQRRPVGHPTVVALADDDLGLRVARQVGEKHRGVHDVNVHAHLVHVPQAGLDAPQLAGIDGRAGPLVVAGCGGSTGCRR